MNKNNLILAGVIVSLLFSIVATFKAPVPGPAGKDGVDGHDGLGSVVGPYLDSPVSSQNGVTTITYGVSYQTATSTMCAIKPLATSTLRFFGSAPTSGTSTPVLVVLEKRVNSVYAPNLSAATSSNVITSKTIPSGSTAEFVFTATSTDSLGRVDVFGPNDTLVYYGKNGGGGSIAQNFGTGSVFPGGRCAAEFKAI